MVTHLLTAVLLLGLHGPIPQGTSDPAGADLALALPDTDADWVAGTVEGLDQVVSKLEALNQKFNLVQVDEGLAAFIGVAHELPVVGTVARIVLPNQLDRLKETMVKHHLETMEKLEKIELKIDDVAENVREIRYHQLLESENQLSRDLLKLQRLLSDRPPTNPTELKELRGDFQELLISAGILLDEHPRDVPFAMALNIAAVALEQMLCSEIQLCAKLSDKPDLEYYSKRSHQLMDLIKRNDACSRHMSLARARADYENEIRKLREAMTPKGLDFLTFQSSSYPLTVEFKGEENLTVKTVSYLLVRKKVTTSDHYEKSYQVRRAPFVTAKGITFFHKISVDDFVPLSSKPSSHQYTRALGAVGCTHQKLLQDYVDDYNAAVSRTRAATINLLRVQAYNEWEQASRRSLSTVGTSLANVK